MQGCPYKGGFLLPALRAMRSIRSPFLARRLPLLGEEFARRAAQLFQTRFDRGKLPFEKRCIVHQRRQVTFATGLFEPFRQIRKRLRAQIGAARLKRMGLLSQCAGVAASQRLAQARHSRRGFVKIIVH